MRKISNCGPLVAGAIVVGMSFPAFAQTSKLYLTEWQTTDVFVVQGGAIIDQFNRASTSDGPGMAIQDTVKCIGQDGGQSGNEYALDGTPLGGSYFNPSYASLYDGATDGVNNWTIAHNDFNTNFALLQADSDWNGLAILFVPAERSSGITYDANSGTLWITNNIGGISDVQNFDLAGNLLSEFPALHSGGGYGIAWDAADDTLWIPGAFGTAGHLFQYDKSGNLLQDIVVSGINNILGAEFATGEAAPCLDLTVSPLTAGQSATWEVTGATAGEQVAIVYGFQAGNTSVNGFAGYCADFGIQGVNQNKLICTKAADGTGYLICKKSIPGGAKGLHVLSQAAERNTCPDICMSNIDDQTVQ